MEPAHVLVPLDGSPLAEEALAHTLAAFDCETTVLSVATPVTSQMSENGVLERARLSAISHAPEPKRVPSVAGRAAAPSHHAGSPSSPHRPVS